MTAGPVNRALLESNFQNDGEIYSDEKTEACFDVVADQIDDNWNYTASLVANGTFSPYPSFLSRQAIINGNFDVWQRGTSFTNPTTSQFTADRWKTQFNTDGGTNPTVVISRQTLNSGDIVNSYFFQRINVDGSGTGYGVSSSYDTRQLIENGTRNLCGAGKTISVSFWARSSTSSKRIGVSFVQNYGTGGSPSSQETISGTISSLTSTWQKYTITITTNTLVGKTFGTNNDDYLGLLFSYQWGTTTATSRFGGGTAESFIGAGNIDIAQIQVNAGDQSLPFQPRSFAEELQLCQRYYEKSYDYTIVPATASSQPGIESRVVPSNTINSVQPYGKVIYKTTKRVVPTVTVYPYSTPSNTGRVSSANGTDLAANSGGVQYSGVTGFTIFNASGGSLSTTDSAVLFHFSADAEL